MVLQRLLVLIPVVLAGVSNALSTTASATQLPDRPDVSAPNSVSVVKLAQAETIEAQAIQPVTPAAQLAEAIGPDPMRQVTSVSQLTDVRPTDWAFQALQSLVERYGCIVGYPDRTYRGNQALTRFEFAAGLNACLDRISELIAAATADLVRKEDLETLRKLQEEFAAELATLRGRVDALEARTATLEKQQFSTTTKLVGQVIVAAQDTFGDSVGEDEDESQVFLGDRVRLNLESSFSGRDFLRVRLQFGNFLNAQGISQIGSVTNTDMTRLNFDTDFENRVFIPHVLYRFPIGENATITVGPTGIGFTDITDTLTPPTIADDGQGVPSLFAQYSPYYRRGGGGGAINWSISEDIILTVGYLAFDPANPAQKNGLFNGGYHAMAQLAFYGNWGAAGIGYAHSYAPGGKIGLFGGAGSRLANQPFGNDIATSSDIVNFSGFYRVSNNFHVHLWGGYLWASAEDSGLSSLSNRRGGSEIEAIEAGDRARGWYGVLGLTFPDVGGRGNLPGLLVGLPPRLSNSDVRDEDDTSVHIEAFYRYQLNDNISITPGVWAVINPENNGNNDTIFVGVLRTYFQF
jgi:hypothetical protein